MVILDVMMPGMDGFEVAKRLKQGSATRDIPIIFLTALATDLHDSLRGYDLGAIDYIVRPVDPDVVKKKVHILVELMSQRAQLAEHARDEREADRRHHALEIAELRIANDRRYRKLVEGIHHAISWTADRNLRLTFISEQAPQLLGYTSEQLLDPALWSLLIHPDDREPMLTLFRRALKESIELASEHRVITPDGRTLWFHTSISGEPGTGAGPELHGISLDITELELARDESRRLARDREDLLAIVTHDLRSPLLAVQLSAALLAEGLVPTEEQRRVGARILHAVSGMDRMIKDLLDFARIRAGELSIDASSFDAAGVVEETSELVAPVAAKKLQTLTWEVERPLHVRADRGRLAQILANLLGNAIKFTDSGGTISLRARTLEDAIEIAITDNGCGIAPDQLAHVFERYWHARSGTHGERGAG
ncbi:MAG: ATP-binding protein, partial [Steroidobacteraceae bacterium]